MANLNLTLVARANGELPKGTFVSAKTIDKAIVKGNRHDSRKHGSVRSILKLNIFCDTGHKAMQ